MKKVAPKSPNRWFWAARILERAEDSRIPSQFPHTQSTVGRVSNKLLFLLFSHKNYYCLQFPPLLGHKNFPPLSLSLYIRKPLFRSLSFCRHSFFFLSLFKVSSISPFFPFTFNSLKYRKTLSSFRLFLLIFFISSLLIPDKTLFSPLFFHSWFFPGFDPFHPVFVNGFLQEASKGWGSQRFRSQEMGYRRNFITVSVETDSYKAQRGLYSWRWVRWRVHNPDGAWVEDTGEVFLPPGAEEAPPCFDMPSSYRSHRVLHSSGLGVSVHVSCWASQLRASFFFF